jgi:hypothetical protein
MVKKGLSFLFQSKKHFLAKMKPNRKNLNFHKNPLLISNYFISFIIFGIMSNLFIAFFLYGHLSCFFGALCLFVFALIWSAFSMHCPLSFLAFTFINLQFPSINSNYNFTFKFYSHFLPIQILAFFAFSFQLFGANLIYFNILIFN